MPDEIEELIKQVDYLEGRMDVPAKNPYLDSVKEDLTSDGTEKDLDTLARELNKDLEGLLDSIGSYKDTIRKAKRNI